MLKDNRKKILFTLKLVLAMCLALLLSYTVFSKNFRVIEPVSEIRIEATAKRNKESAGSDIRLKNVVIDGKEISFDDLIVNEDWKHMDGLLVVINPQRPTAIEYKAYNAEILEIGLQKHVGSGVIAISVNGRQIGELDLYSPEWDNITFKKNIAPIKLTSNIGIFMIICISCIILVFGIEKLAIVVKGNEKYIFLMKCGLAVCISFILLFLCWFQMEMSCAYENIAQIFSMEWKYILLNILTELVILVGLQIVLRKLWLTGVVFSILSFLIAIINFYTIKFHGSPLSVLEIKNINTAMNVIGSYKIRLDEKAVVIIAIFASCIVLSLILKLIKIGCYKWELKKCLFRDTCVSVVAVLTIYGGYFSPFSIKPMKTIGDRWEQAYHQYGYLACSVELIYRSNHAVDMPEGYSDEKVKNIEITRQEVEGVDRNPDIILILNETFFDLRQITDMKTDIPFMENIDSMTDVIRGYTVVPSIGGRTNATEYELLTSNSLQLMQGITPFSILDLSDANSIVSLVKQLGYQTTGMHSESSKNYFRGRAYPELGFDEIHFEGDFKDREYYGNRIYYETDDCLYNNLISWYEQKDKDIPQFMYMLTIQNHGEWDENSPEDDIVHVLNDYGNYNQQINEYLSCIHMSDVAMKKLTEYFENVDRPVIICMVGDHSPSFASSIIDNSFSEEDKQLRLRGTPFIIWSNFGLEGKDVGYISMNYLAPLLLQTAGIKGSLYYDYMIRLKERVPILTAYDVYRDAEGKEYSYTDMTEYTDEVKNYFYLEYNNLQKNRIQNIFDAYE